MPLIIAYLCCRPHPNADQPNTKPNPAGREMKRKRSIWSTSESATSKWRQGGEETSGWASVTSWAAQILVWCGPIKTSLFVCYLFLFKGRRVQGCMTLCPSFQEWSGSEFNFGYQERISLFISLMCCTKRLQVKSAWTTICASDH